ncbi:biliverdin-producing heme oxygenase [Pigmentibacter ruber]|uniref:biliverdin-producing heme oxygenase n=1 Tax=Pigmentibacter ruber TaxID=2683196 RepID=UPI00131D2DF2|nr:biliverdin-producing heme oxygenase [Pigmentibacter ruber]
MENNLRNSLKEMNIRQLLREQTKNNHDIVEKLNYLSKDNVSKMDYIKFLIVFFKIVFPIEQIYDKKFKTEIEISFEPSFKTELILSDLKNLNVDFSQIKSTNFLPKIETKFQMIGALYVLEGSVLGATMLYSKLLSLFGEEFKENLHYLYGYGKDNFIKWKNFLKLLDSYEAISNHSKLEILETAKSTFDCFANEFKAT